MPRGESYLWDDTVIADGAITDRAVVVRSTAVGSGKIAPATNSSKVLGVASQAADTAKPCNITRRGVAEVIAAGVIAIGDYVITSGALGRVESLGTLSPGTASIKYIVGEANTAASTAADILEITLNPILHYAA